MRTRVRVWIGGSEVKSGDSRTEVKSQWYTVGVERSLGGSGLDRLAPS